MENGRVLVRDRPGAWWFLSFLFVTVSSAFLYLAATERTLPAWQTGLVALMGIAGLGAGIWFCAQSPRTTISVDETAGLLRITRSGITGRSHRDIPLDSIRRIVIERRDDDDGYGMSRPLLQLNDGEQVLLSVLWRHGDVDTRLIVDSIVQVQPRLAPQKN